MTDSVQVNWWGIIIFLVVVVTLIVLTVVFARGEPLQEVITNCTAYGCRGV
jgi:hypothetical protein